MNTVKKEIPMKTIGLAEQERCNGGNWDEGCTEWVWVREWKMYTCASYVA